MDVAIVGDRRSTLPGDWTSETVVALIGDVSVDASAGASEGASLTCVSLLGDVRVRVPRGSRVREGGFTLLGDRRRDVSAGEGPEIRVGVYSLFGDVVVTDAPA